MKFDWGRVCFLIIAVTVQAAVEQCRREVHEDMCWARLNHTKFCENFTTSALICSDLTQLDSNSGDAKIVTSITIDNNNVSDSIEAGLFQRFHKVIAININNSRISYIAPGAFEDLTDLRYLFVHDNNIEELSGEIFKGMDKIDVLTLSGNDISSVGEDTFGDMSKLKELYLDNNRIDDLSFLSNGCDELVYLDLSYNEIETLELPKGSNLKYLSIAGNKIRNLTESIFRNKTLIYLDISDNMMTDIGDEFLRNLLVLEVLHLSRNSLFATKDVPLHFFQNSLMLKTLNLSSTSIKRLNNGVFSILKELEVLDLSMNALKILPKHLFYMLYNLKELRLSGNLLTYIEWSEFSYLRKPLHVYLDKNKWNCETLAQISTKKPYYISIVSNDIYDTANILGVSCETELENILNVPLPNSSDLTSLQRRYLWSLVNAQTDMKKAFAELKVYLNHTNLKQRHYSKGYLESMHGSLLVRDAVLFSIFIAVLTVAAILVLVYFGNNRRPGNNMERGDLLRGISTSS